MTDKTKPKRKRLTPEQAARSEQIARIVRAMMGPVGGYEHLEQEGKRGK